ncbi:hypothetical protein WDU94_004670 [Cyamophila willieti]
MNSLKRTETSSVFDEVVSIKKSKQDGVKPPLPKELTKLFQPLFCALCKSQLSSPVTAASHYSGKNHQKKVKQYLTQNNPELLPAEETTTSKKQATRSEQIITSLTPDQASSCRICDVVFAGPVAAQSHYMGKKHRSKVFKGHTPIERVPGMDMGEDASGRFGIGESFRNQGDPIPTPNVPDLKRTVQKLYCDICDIQATDDGQYKAHLAGKKHIKNVNKLKLVNPTAKIINPMNSKDTVLDSVLKAPKVGEEQDYSIHRTPSGNYYCKICDLTVNSVNQYSDHLESKKHKKKKASSTTSA